jgi:radical SAM superfamily enzyme YgiQ (UPF0313 family)
MQGKVGIQREGIDRVLLVSAPLDESANRAFAVNSKCFAPLALIEMATLLRAAVPTIEVRVLDGDLLGLDVLASLIADFRPDVVGVSALTPTYRSALRIAGQARAAGARYVVLGNDHVSFFPELVLRRNPDVSFVILGDDGAHDFVELIKALRAGNDPMLHVASLHAAVDGVPRVSEVSPRAMHARWQSDDVPDPSFMPVSSLAAYQDSYDLRFSTGGIRHAVRPFIINNAKGCHKAGNRCHYCSIFDLRVSAGDVTRFWKMVERYWHDYGFNLFFEVCDNFGALRGYRRALAQSVPEWYKEASLGLMVYTDADVLTRDGEALSDFRRLNVQKVNMGLDSADPLVLRSLKGFGGAELNRHAVDLLGSVGIQIHCSFVLGGPGENEESLARTATFIEELVEKPHVVAVDVSPLFPLPSAPAWKLLLGQRDDSTESLLRQCGRTTADVEAMWEEARGNFANNDVIDLTVASRLWADHLTFVGHERLRAVVAHLNQTIAAAGKATGGFG